MLGSTFPVPDITVKALATFNITVTGPDPDIVSVVVVEPLSQVALPPSRNGNVFTFRVDPDLNWRFKVTAPAHVTQLVDPTGAIDPTPGQTINRPIALVARAV